MVQRAHGDGLRIAPGIVLPPSIVGMRTPVLAEPGAGKSVLNAVIMEELWRARLQFASFDFVGTAWGVKASADGKSAGIALPYLGAGRYADAPLRPDSGVIVARALVETGASMMFNLSGFGREDQNRFVADFWNELLLLAAARHDAGDPLSILNLVDEASFVMPETPRGQQQARAQDAGERVSRQGRALGLGFVASTQRPQAIDKDVLGVWEALILMRLTERAAIKRAMDIIGHVVDEDVLRKIQTSLPRLRDGEAWFISPRALKIVKRVQLRMRETYDSTRTPTPGERRRAPTLLAQADLSALRDALAAPIDADDEPSPSRSRAGGRSVAASTRGYEEQIADLRRQLAAVPKKPERIEVSVLTDSDRELLDRAAAAVNAASAEIHSLAEALTAVGNNASAKIAAEAPAVITAHIPPAKQKAPATVAARRTPRERPAAIDTPRGAAGSTLKKGARRMLAALAQVYPIKLTAPQLAAVARLTTRGGTFGTYLSILKREGHIRESSGLLAITPSGFDVIGQARPQKPTSRREAISTLRNSFKAGARAMVDVLLSVGKRGVTREQLARGVGMAATGGTFGTYLAILKRNGLAIEEKRGDEICVRMSDTLFATAG